MGQKGNPVGLLWLLLLVIILLHGTECCYRNRGTSEEGLIVPSITTHEPETNTSISQESIPGSTSDGISTTTTYSKNKTETVHNNLPMPISEQRASVNFLRNCDSHSFIHSKILILPFCALKNVYVKWPRTCRPGCTWIPFSKRCDCEPGSIDYP